MIDLISSPLTRTPAGTARVLIIDDEPSILSVLYSLLSDQYECKTASCAAEALEHLKEDNFDLVLSDIMMPGMSGWEFRAVMTKEPDLARIPIVVLSGVRDVAQQAMQIEAVAYLQKPVDIERLLSEVGRHC